MWVSQEVMLWASRWLQLEYSHDWQERKSAVADNGQTDKQRRRPNESPIYINIYIYIYGK